MINDVYYVDGEIDIWGPAVATATAYGDLVRDAIARTGMQVTEVRFSRAGWAKYKRDIWKFVALTTEREPEIEKTNRLSWNFGHGSVDLGWYDWVPEGKIEIVMSEREMAKT